MDLYWHNRGRAWLGSLSMAVQVAGQDGSQDRLSPTLLEAGEETSDLSRKIKLKRTAQLPQTQMSRNRNDSYVECVCQGWSLACP